MVNPRTKGHGFESRMVNRIHADLGIAAKRNLDQYRLEHQGDIIVDDPNFLFPAIECKRYATGPFQKDWMEQAKRAAQKLDGQPCVIFKFDYKPVQVAMLLSTVLDVGCHNRPPSGAVITSQEIVFTSWDGFCTIAREAM